MRIHVTDTKKPDLPAPCRPETRLEAKSCLLMAIVLAIGLMLCGDGFAIPIEEAKSEKEPAASASEIEELVEQLGADSFVDRQKAASRLLEIGEPALPAVTKAAEGEDSEVRLLAKRIKHTVEIAGADVIDLAGFANHPRNEGFGVFPENNLESLDGGLREFGGTPFNVGDKVAFLGSDRMPEHPRKIEGLKVGRKLAELHFLHGMGFGLAHGVREGAHVANYVVHYSDKSKAEIPIVEGVDVRNWWDEEGGLPVTKGKVAWTGKNAAAARFGNTLRLYSGVWKNPHPEKEITTIDLVGKHDTSLLFCVAITAVGTEEGEAAEKEGEAEAAVRRLER